MPRFHCPVLLAPGLELDLPDGAARHVQVLRMQPGETVTLFGSDAAGGPAGEFEATILRMGRSDVRVRVGPHTPADREAPRTVHLLAGITAGDRMDWLVEKATELGAASITPLLAERSVLRLKGERADKKRAHWQAVAVAACEQCGRNRVPPVPAAQELAAWVQAHGPAPTATPTDTGTPGAAPLRLLLSLGDGTVPLAQALQAAPAQAPVVFLSGPEGGLSPAEEACARAAGFVPVTLGPRVLRAETAPLAALAAITLA